MPGDSDMLALLTERATARERAAAASAADDAVEADPSTAGIPFRPRFMRAFMLWESHVIGSSRMLVKHFSRGDLARRQRVREDRPHLPKAEAEQALLGGADVYMANHTMVLADGEEM